VKRPPVVFAASLLLGSQAWGEPLSPAIDPGVETSALERSVVPIGVVEGDELFEVDPFRPVVAGHFSATELTPQVEALPADTNFMQHLEWALDRSAEANVRAVFWLEPVSVERHLLYVLQPGSKRLWVRELPQATEPDLVRESAGIMMSTLARGLVESADVLPGMDRIEDQREPVTIETPVPSPAEEPPVADVARVEGSLGVEYVGGSLAAQAPWQNGVGGHVDIVLRSGPFFRLSSAFLVPARLGGELALETWRVPIVATAGYRFRDGARARPEVGLAAVAEVFSWTAQDGAEIRGRAGTTGRFAISPEVGLTWRVFRRFGLHLFARMDIWLANVDLVTELASGRESRFRPHAVSATLQAGFHYAL